MSADRNFDDFVKGEFKNYSPNVPAHIWENIVAERKDRKPVGFWFTLFSGANLIWMMGLMIAGVTGVFIVSQKTATSGNNKPEAANTINRSANNSTTSATNNTATTTSTISTVTVNEQNNHQLPKINNSLATTAVMQSSSIKQQQNSGVAQTTVPVENALTTATVKNKVGSTRHQLHARGSFHIKTTEGSDYTSAESLRSNTDAVLEDDNTIVTSVSGNPSSPAYANIGKGITSTATKAAYEKANLLSFNLKSAQPSLYSNNMHLPECPTLENEAAGNKRYIEFYIAPDYAIRTLTDTANSVYLQKRKASTTVSSAFSAGIRYTKVFNNCMSIRFGLNYSQINETFTYVQGNVVQTTYNIDPVTGDTTGSYTVRGTNYKTTYNHYRYLDIPITIGYELGNGRFHANINAGIIANIYSWQKGDELDTNLQPVSITTGKGPLAYQFRTNIGLGATGGASVYYKLTDQLHLMAEPYIRYNFQPLSRDNITLRQNYTTMGLRLGVRFDLHNPGSIINK